MALEEQEQQRCPSGLHCFWGDPGPTMQLPTKFSIGTSSGSPQTELRHHKAPGLQVGPGGAKALAALAHWPVKYELDWRSEDNSTAHHCTTESWCVPEWNPR